MSTVPSTPTFEIATDAIYDEEGYLRANPDVAAAVAAGHIADGRAHFEEHGGKEGRRQRPGYLVDAIARLRAHKLRKLKPLLRPELALKMRDDGLIDALSAEDRTRFGVIDTENVSGHHYDATVLDIIETYRDGLVLDCGAGMRPEYFENVVNYEIVDYPSTDVVGVAERLPFEDGAFDAVVSIAVLEHVKYPFQAAKEIARVLKPGGTLAVCVPFLQPLHGYPNHYFNMTRSGLQALFEDAIAVDRHFVPDSASPIWSLTWFLSSWASGLDEETRKGFLDMSVGDLLGDPRSYLERPFCRNLPEDSRFELASATFLVGTKR